MLSRKIIRKQRGRRFLLAGAGVALFVASLAIAGLAFAVHDDSFQLDGNLLNNCPPAPDTGTCTASMKDWADLFTVTTTATTQTVANSSVINPSGSFTNATFIRDFESGAGCTLNSTSTTFCTGDDSTFATGSKDTLDINKWQCNHDNNVNSKIDIMNAYAAAFTASNGDKIMYFGLEKNKDNGTNDVGFWFLQGDAGCTAPTGHKDFSGVHTLGDVLVVSEFTNGGGVSNITAYRWQGGSNPLVQIGTAGDCKGSGGGDNMCATTNSGAKAFNSTVTTPWLTSDATGGIGTSKIVPPDFFEGGINLTKAFQQSGGGTVPSCFNTFIADTRSSNVTGSTLFDFARGVLGQCNTTLATDAGISATPKQGESGSPADIGGGSVSSGTDTATVTVTGTSNWTGTLTFYLCGPDSALSSCDRTKGVLVTTTNNVTANGDYVSGTATLTSAGKYCWTAHFEPSAASKTAGVKAADDDGTNECFTVAPVTPSLDTCSGTYDASNVCTPAGTVDFGNSISDRVIVSGLAKEPGSNGGNTNYPTINANNGAYAGVITVTLKGPADTGCGSTTTGGTGTNPATVNIDTTTGNKQYGPVSYTPASPGNYHWQASLANASSVNNSLPVSHNASCNDTDEDVTVRQIPTEITTAPSYFPQDSAVITSSLTGNSLPAGGSVIFRLYNSSANCLLHGTTVGQGGLLYSESVTLGAAAHSQNAATNNTTVSVSSTGSVWWRVTYAPGDSAHTGRQSDCVENINATITGDSGPGTLFP